MFKIILRLHYRDGSTKMGYLDKERLFETGIDVLDYLRNEVLPRKEKEIATAIGVTAYAYFREDCGYTLYDMDELYYSEIEEYSTHPFGEPDAFDEGYKAWKLSWTVMR